MDRRVLAIAAVLAAACSSAGTPAPPGDAGAKAHPHAVAPAPAAPPVAAPADEVDAEPITPAQVLSGAAAEEAIAAAPPPATPPADVAGDDGDGRGVTSDGVAPFRLGMSRAEVIRELTGRGVLKRRKVPAGQPTLEIAVLAGAQGAPALQLRVYAGRLVEIAVLAREPGLTTDGGVGVGSTFEAAIDAHGDPRRVEDERTGEGRGFVLSELPGVLFVPVDAGELAADAPAPAARIGRIVVLGPEALAPND